jgi:hypothetical protein
MIDVVAMTGVALFQVVLGGVLGLLIGGAAGWVLWGRRPDLDREQQAADVAALTRPELALRRGERLRAWRHGLSEPTRLAIGFSLLLVGYHAAAYLFPDTWLEFRIPEARWWALVGVVVVLVGGSMAMDKMEGRG